MLYPPAHARFSNDSPITTNPDGLDGGADRIRTLSSLLGLSDEQSLGEFKWPAPDSLTALLSAEAALVYVYYLDFFLFTRS